MKLKIVDIDNFCSDLNEVLNPKSFESGKFTKSGLFSQQTFGPIKSYCCACNRVTYRGRSTSEAKCKKCDVDITSSEERRRRFAKISLPFPIFNPLMYYIVCFAKPSFKKPLFNILSYNKHFILDKDKMKLTPVEFEDINSLQESGEELLIGLPGAMKIVEAILEKETGQEVQFIRDNYNKITIENVVVIPPDFRPCSGNASGGKVLDEINSIYSRLITKTNRVKQIPFTLKETDDIFRSNYRHIQLSVIRLFDFVLKKLSKKEGLIRGNILGKRIDFSGRAVISPDPTLALNQCRIPYWMILEMLKPQFVNYLVNRRVCKRYNQAVKLVEDCIKTNDTHLFNLACEFAKDKIAILNRQPTLHRLGVLAFDVTLHLGNTIAIHPMICHPYNADFDGDAMAIYFPVTKESENEAREKLSICANLLSQTDIDLVPKHNQDITLGVYVASKDENWSEENLRELDWKKPDEDGNKPKLPIGKYFFNKCLPEDYKIIKSACNSRKLSLILNDIALKYPPSEVINTLDRIKQLGFLKSTIEGYTLGIDDLYSSQLSELNQKLTGNMHEDMRMMKSKEIMDILKTSSFTDFIESGARGSWDQVKQLVFSRGYVSDSKGRIRPKPIKNSLVRGLNQNDFFESCWGARKGLLDTALSTGDSGYLTRQLIYSTSFIEIDDTLEDCGTKDTMELFVEPGMGQTLLWRNFINEDGQVTRITRKNFKELEGKTIKLRSPIYCESDKICKTCYGNLFKILHSNQIGIIATQAVGERTTQLVLRTFHLGGVAQGGERGDEQEDIISGIQIANTLFHNPNKLIKELNRPVDLVSAIYKLFNEYKAIHMIHYEVIVSAMMWNGNNLWRTLENRNDTPYQWVSILQIPSKSSWLLGCAFSNLKTKILEGLVYNKSDNVSSLSKLFRF